MEHDLRLVITKDTEGKASHHDSNQRFQHNGGRDLSYLSLPLANRTFLQVDQATSDD